MLAYGGTNVFGSFFLAWPAGASLSRSSVNESAGSKTQVAGLISCLIVLVVLLFVGPLFESLPMCVLAAIIMVALKGMFMQLGELKFLWRVSKIDFLIWLVAFVATCVLDITFGLVVSVFFELLTIVYRSLRPVSETMNRYSDTEIFLSKQKLKDEPHGEHDSQSLTLSGDVRLFRFEAAVFYANAEVFRRALYKRCNVDYEGLRQEAYVRKLLEQKLSRRREERESGQLPSAVSRMMDRIRGTSLRLPGMNRKRSDTTPVAVNNKLRSNVVENGYKPESKRAHEKHPPRSGSPADPGHAYRPGYRALPIPPRYIIVDFSVVAYVDTMGANVMLQVYKELAAVGSRLLVSGCNESVFAMLSSSGVMAEFLKLAPHPHSPLGRDTGPPEVFFPTLIDAVSFIERESRWVEPRSSSREAQSPEAEKEEKARLAETEASLTEE